MSTPVVGPFAPPPAVLLLRQSRYDVTKFTQLIESATGSTAERRTGALVTSFYDQDPADGRSCLQLVGGDA